MNVYGPGVEVLGPRPHRPWSSIHIEGSNHNPMLALRLESLRFPQSGSGVTATGDDIAEAKQQQRGAGIPVIIDSNSISSSSSSSSISISSSSSSSSDPVGPSALRDLAIAGLDGLSVAFSGLSGLAATANPTESQESPKECVSSILGEGLGLRAWGIV